MAFDLSIKTHKFSMKLPKYELYEAGSQVRRSSKSIPLNIAEGYGRRKYKEDFIRFLIIAHASCNETIAVLTILNTIYSSHTEIPELIKDYNQLGGMLNRFISSTNKKHHSLK